MLINEIPPNTEISVLVHKGLDNLTFKTKSVEITNDEEAKLLARLQKTYPNKYFVVTELIKENDKVVGFPVGNIQYIMDCVVDNRPYLFNGIQINAIKLPTGSEYHLIFSDKNMAPYNRRKEFRLWVGIDGIAQLGLNKAGREVVIKDVSANGIGFTTGSDYECEVGNIAHITFHDKLVDRSTRKITEVKFSVSATVVQIRDVDEHTKHIGCRVNNKAYTTNIEKYIATKQVERMQHGRPGAGNADDKQNK